jgi:hypothetical protein
MTSHSRRDLSRFGITCASAADDDIGKEVNLVIVPENSN